MEFAYLLFHPHAAGSGGPTRRQWPSGSGPQGAEKRKTGPKPRAEGEFLSTSGEISGIEARPYAWEPRADIEPLHQLPEAGHQDINNARVRVPAYEGWRPIIVIEVYPAAGSPDGGSAVIEEENEGHQLHAVNQIGVAKEIRPNIGSASSASGVHVRGRAASVEQ